MNLCHTKIKTLDEFYRKYNATFEYQLTNEEFNSAYGLLSFINDNFNNNDILLNCCNIPNLHYPNNNIHSLISDIKESVEHYKDYIHSNRCILDTQQIIDLNNLIIHIERNIYYQNIINV